MNNTERHALADAYMAAWHAVKGSPCTVLVWPHGWFVVDALGMTNRRRAAYLLDGLRALTERMKRGDAHVVRQHAEAPHLAA